MRSVPGAKTWMRFREFLEGAAVAKVYTGAGKKPSFLKKFLGFSFFRFLTLFKGFKGF